MNKLMLILITSMFAMACENGVNHKYNENNKKDPCKEDPCKENSCKKTYKHRRW